MQKGLKFYIAVIFVVFGIFGFVSRTFGNLYQSAGQRGGQVVNTRDIFMHDCARCHGVDGRGQTELGRKYDVPDLVTESKRNSSAKLVRTITNGKTDMPAFGKKLTKRQIAALASYIKKL
jgi:mono/diheme cytochrome c family protein